MGVLQRELERSFDNLPEEVLRNILKRKLKEAGRRLPRATFDALVRHLLDGNEDEFEWDAPGGRDLQLEFNDCLLYTSPSPRDGLLSRMPSSA